MALRVPKAELSPELRESMITQLGAVPEPVEVLWHTPEVARAGLEFGARVGAWDAADAGLKTFAHMAVAAQVGCSWCLDVNYFLAQNQRRDLTKASQVPSWQDTDLFTPLERDVLEYAEAMTRTPVEVSDELFAQLKDHFDERQLVELTMVVALENLYTRFNWAMGIEGEGFSEGMYCVAPQAQGNGQLAAA
jgi:alkylhydroperoxidase family enzyme